MQQELVTYYHSEDASDVTVVTMDVDFASCFSLMKRVKSIILRAGRRASDDLHEKNGCHNSHQRIKGAFICAKLLTYMDIVDSSDAEIRLPRWLLSQLG
jgi:hypothetical protein